ncbi:hypothetical protein K502DRAFT_316017 [Neoconidiobolus thromboides FSU 785]|nr:hypothetical protein K502DRAFT_316017 [Neoconidiobolus thromboides FSU 785]
MNLNEIVLNYKEKVNENLICSICCQPYIDPVTTPCHHYYCKGCINQALDIKEECPIDRLPLNDLILQECPSIISNMINELEVLCPNSEIGCEHSCQRSLLLNHIENCQFKRGTSEGKDEILKENENKCPHCNKEIRKEEIIRHILDCDQLKISCSCQRYGCSWRGIKKDLEQHNQSCYYIKLEPILGKQENRITELENTNGQLKALLQELNVKLKHTVDELHQIRNCNTSNNLEAPRPIAFPGEEMAAAMLERMHLEHQRLRFEVINLTSNLQSMDLKHDLALANETLQLREQIQNLRSSYQGLRSDLDTFSLERHASTLSAIANLHKASRSTRPTSFMHSSKSGRSSDYKL